MKKIALSLLLSALTFTAAQAQQPERLPLPDTGYRLQSEAQKQLAIDAAARYADPTDSNIWEEGACNWNGKPWTLLFVNYLAATDKARWEYNDQTGRAEEKYSRADWEAVCTAMFSHYAQATGFNFPSTNPDRFRAIEREVTGMMDVLKPLLEGSQMEMNCYAGTDALVMDYLSLRLERQLREAAPATWRDALQAEAKAWDALARSLCALNADYSLAVLGGGTYFSMMPLLTAGYEEGLFETRIKALKRLSQLMGVADFVEPPLETDERVLDRMEGLAVAYAENLSETEVGDVTTQSLETVLDKMNEYLEVYDAVVALLPEESQEACRDEAMAYVEQFCKALSSDIEDGEEE